VVVVSLRLRPPASWRRIEPDAERGAVALVVAAFMVVVLGLAAIVIDLGFARDRIRVAQNAADAAALAAAQSLSTAANPLTPTAAEQTAATGAAQTYATANGWRQTVTVRYDLARFVVTVQLGTEPEPSFFGGAVGNASTTVGGTAAARWADPAAAAPCSVCILGDLDQRANGDIFVTQGDVRVGGRVLVGPNSRLQDSNGKVYAGNLAGSNIAGTLSPAPLRQQVGPLTDPFLGLPTPPLNQPIAPSPSGACTAGTYASIDGCSTLGPGVYVLTGASRFTGGSGNVTGNGVLLYLACSSGGRSASCLAGQAGASISVNGGPSVSVGLTAAAGGPWAGVGIFADRNNTASVDVAGGSFFSIANGSLYLKAGTLLHSGNPDLTVGGSVVVGDYRANGNPNPLRVGGAGTAPAPPPPLGGPVSLVK
jgi:Putative Flp pilus-assembly TadE/G-like